MAAASRTTNVRKESSMTRHGWLRRHATPLLVTPLLVLGVLSTAPANAQAVVTEYRDYVVTVDGKDSGKTHVTITDQDDGTLVMAAKAAVRVNKGVFSYSYDVQATEWWKGDRLVGIKISANDNGTRMELSGAADGNQLRLKVNARERLLRQDLWVNSFWKLADSRYHNNSVPVLDADTGREYVGQLKYIGAEKITVGKQPAKTYHFRVSGGPLTHDLWYDESHRLVRHEFTEKGQRVVVHMVAVRR